MSSYKECIICSFYLISGLALLAGTISYAVFAIIYLIEDYGISNDCKGSNLWEYVLVSIILGTGNLSIKGDVSMNSAIIIFVIIGIINLCLATWGSIELWKYSYSCDDLFHSNLWYIGLVSFILQVFATVICVILPPILLCYYTMSDLDVKSSNNQESTDVNNLSLKINTDV